MPLSDQEKMLVRKHLGYPTISQAVVPQQGGYPIATAVYFVLEGAMDHLLAGSIGLVQTKIAQLENIENALDSAIQRLAASRLGDLVLRTGRSGESEPDLLRKERANRRKELADLLGVQLYPGALQNMGSTNSILRYPS